jgi:5''-nucleotidase/2'',3''-cyclic phosphodiesterase and related esterases
MKYFSLYTCCLSLLLAPTIPLAAQENDSDAKIITILAVNDMHAAIDMFPKFATVVDSIRNIHPNLLLLAAGDNRTGNPVNDRFSEVGYPMTDLMNRLGFDASAVGNHEFDANVAAFRNLIGKSNFRYLCANMDAPDSLRLHIAPFRFYEREGIRIGILGLIQTGPNGLPDTHPRNVENISFRPAVETAKDYAWMRDACDVFILLTHCGYEEDLELAEAYPQADIIIGGHSHTVVSNRVLRNGILVSQTGRALKCLTEIQVEVSGGRLTATNYKLINLTADRQAKPEIQAVVDAYNANETLKQVLTTVATPFENAEELGCLMADAQRHGANGDIAIQNFGGVRYETHATGDFTMKDAFALDPFDNSLMAYELTGEEVQQMLVSAYEIGEDPYVSGISYTISFHADNSVKKLTVFSSDGKPIAPKKTYRVIINNYLSSVCPFLKTKAGEDTFVGATNALVDYLKQQPSVSYQGGKRITVVN